jgi:hypothetical protein
MESKAPEDPQDASQAEQLAELAPRWPLWVLVARLMSCGMTQAEAAGVAGVGTRTVERWANDDRWPDAVAAAEAGWLAQLRTVSRSTLLREAATSAAVASKVLDKLSPALRPIFPSESLAAASALPTVVIAGSVFGFEHRAPVEPVAVQLPPGAVQLLPAAEVG